MIEIRPGLTRGYRDHGWLKTYHSFSFGDYQNPLRHHYRALRVINEDRVAPGKGFPTHEHQNMEIITYVLSGELAHRDSMGNGSTIKPHHVQKMSAGSGITHSEMNPSPNQEVHLLQIWIIPEENQLSPDYMDWTPPQNIIPHRWHPIATQDGKEGSTIIHRKASIWLWRGGNNVRSSLPSLQKGRYGYLHVAQGSIRYETQTLDAGDALTCNDADLVTFTVTRDETCLLWFDLD